MIDHAVRRLGCHFVIGLFVITAIVASGVVVAHADPTAAEKQGLLHLREAWVALQDVMSGYTVVVTSKYTTVANHQAVGSAQLITVQAIEALNDAISICFGVNPNVAGSSSFDAFALNTRAAKVAWAHTRLDRALSKAHASLSAWAAIRTGPAESLDAVKRITWGLTAAIENINAFDRSLRFETYYPGVSTPNGAHTIVGPHGDYDRTQWSLWRSVVYFTRAMSDLSQAVRLGYPGNDYAGAGEPYQRLAQTNRNSMDAMFINGAVPYSSDLQTKDRFFQVLAGLELLTTQDYPGTPMALHFISFSWKTTYFPKFNRNAAWDALIWDAISITHDAWKHSDNAAWMMMVFPDCSMLRNPAGCAGR